MVTCVIKLNDEGFCDIERNNISFRAFWTEQFVIVLRMDIMVESGTPWAPIIKYVGNEPLATYQEFMSIVNCLSVGHLKETYYLKDVPRAERRNLYGAVNPLQVKQLIQSKYRSWRTLQYSPIGGY